MERDLKEPVKISHKEGRGETPQILPDKKDPLKTETQDASNESINGERKDHHSLSEAARLHIALKVIDRYPVK